MADENNTDTSTDAPAGGDSLHDDISRAFDQVETRDAPPAGDAATPAKPQAAPTEAPAPAVPGERARGPDGRFAPSDATAKPAAPPPAAPPKQELAAPPKLPPTNGQKPPEAAPAPAAPALRPPVSWKPGAREHWAKLPVEVQQEVARREAEVARSMQESSRARDALTHVQQVIGPYAQNIAATGGDAITMIGSLMRADNTLRHGSVAEKAHLAADIIKSYGVSIEALDQALAGQTPTADPNAQLADRLRKEMQAQLQPVMQYFNHMQ